MKSIYLAKVVKLEMSDGSEDWRVEVETCDDEKIHFSCISEEGAKELAKEINRSASWVQIQG